MDDTPLIIVSTRNQIMRHRRSNKDTMNKEQKAASARSFGGLSRPYNSTYVNVVMANSDLPTPDRANEVMAYAEVAL